MPKSKHRRKPGEKAVTHPGRTKMLRAGLPERLRLTGVDDLPLWRSADTVASRLTRAEWEALEREQARDVAAAFEHFASDRLPPELIAEYKALRLEHARLSNEGLDLPDEQEQRLIELERAVKTAVPDDLIRDYLVEHFGYGTEARPLPANILWDPVGTN